MPARGSVSFGAAMGMVVTALLLGLLASLALRPPGQARPAAGAGDGGPAQERLSWRVTSAFNTRLPVLGDGMNYLVDQVAAASGERLRLEIFEPGELAPAFAVTESVRAGKVEAGFTWLGYDQGRIPAASLLGAVPFGMEPPAYLAWWTEGGGRELTEALYAEHGVHPLLCGLSGPETAGWFRQPLESVDDLQGLKIRFSGLAGKVLQRLGASVTVLPAGEIFQALEKGAIDASEFSQPVIDEMLGFDRVVKINYFPGWHQTFSSYHLLVNAGLWSGLAASTRQLLETACLAATAHSYAVSEARQGPVIAGYAAKGVSARTLPAPLLAELRSATEAVLAEEAAGDPWFARVLASQRDFAADYALWAQRAFLPRAPPEPPGD